MNSQSFLDQKSLKQHKISSFKSIMIICNNLFILKILKQNKRPTPRHIGMLNDNPLTPFWDPALILRKLICAYYAENQFSCNMCSNKTYKKPGLHLNQIEVGFQGAHLTSSPKLSYLIF